MNFKTTYILFSVLAAMILVLALSLWNGPLPEDTNALVFPSSRDLVNKVTAEKITEVDIDFDKAGKSGKEHWVFVRNPEDNGWSITEPRAMRGNSTAITGLIEQVLGAERDKSTEKPEKLADWGLEAPKEVITLKRDKGEPLVLKIGDTTSGERYAVTYVLSSDRPKDPLAVKKSNLDKTAQPLVAYRDRDLLTSRESDIQAVSLSETDNGKEKPDPVELVKRNDRWYYDKPFKGDADKEGDTAAPPAGQPPSGVQGLLTELTNLRVDKDADFVANDVSEADQAKYNLGDKNDVLKIQIKRTDKITKTTNKEGEKSEPEIKSSTIALLVGVGKKVDDKSDQYYARRADEMDVVRISAKNVDPLRKLLDQQDALRDRRLVRLDNFRQPDAMDIKLEGKGGVLEFRQTESTKPWQFYRGAKEEKVDEKVVKGLVSMLTERRKDIKFLKADQIKEAETELANPAAVVSLWVEGVKKEEKKDETIEEKKDGKEADKKPAKPTLKMPEKPNYRLTFARLKDSKATDDVVKREVEGEETTYLRVPVLVYERVTEGPLAYMDKTLPQYNAGADALKDVVKLTYEQGGVTREVTRDKPEGPWKIVKPADEAGREADPVPVSMILENLNRLHAVKLVAEEASKDDLEQKYGLKTPSARAVVTVKKDGKETNYEFDFGKKDGTTLYAKQSQSGTIFTVDESALAGFKDSLLSKAIFHFDPTKVKTLKVTGWAKVVGKPHTITVEHKDGKTWSSPEVKDIDTAKVNSLVNELSNLRAEKFVSHKSQPTPAQELDVPKGALQIEITIEGEKEPLQLTLGKLETEGYVATSNKLPGDIFIVSKAPFEAVLSKPAYFNP